MIDQRFAPYSALLLRVSLGVLFLAHGLLLKVMTFTPAGTAAFFEKIGYPGFLAYVVIIAEIAGGIALILGAYTRLVSLLFVPLMIGATLQHIGNGWGFGNPGGGWEFPVLWIALLFVQAGLGSGAYALKLPTFGKQVLA
jgi:putative oxidoreductase